MSKIREYTTGGHAPILGNPSFGRVSGCCHGYCDKAPIKFEKIIMVMTALIGHVIGKYVSCVSNWPVRAIACTLLDELKVRKGN